jgi:hypothetical protein
VKLVQSIFLMIPKNFFCRPGGIAGDAFVQLRPINGRALQVCQTDPVERRILVPYRVLSFASPSICRRDLEAGRKSTRLVPVIDKSLAGRV